MFKVNPRASFGPLTSEEDDNDDSISVTSTVSGHDPEQEFVVEGILAERKRRDGTMCYLVEWEDFPLHQSTWEPESNLGPELMALWEEEKAKHATGESQPFDIRKFVDARKQAAKEKLARHHRRNRKRKFLGLPLTSPIEKDSSDEEAVEEIEIEISSAEPSQAAGLQKQPKASKQLPNPKPTGTSIASQSVGSSRRLNDARRLSTDVQDVQTELSSTNPGRKQTTSSQAGYQGASRRPVDRAAQGAVPKSNRHTITIPTTTVPPGQSTARTHTSHTAKKSTTQATGNIFTSGRVTRFRASINDSMSDPSKDPKLFGKYRQRRLAYKRSREKEDLPPLDISNLELYDLRRTQTLSAQSSGGFVMSPAQVLSPQQEDGRALPIEPSQPPTTIVDNPVAAPSKKKRKSVRFQFLGDHEDQLDLVQETEQMDLGDPAALERSQALQPPSTPQRNTSDSNCWPPSIQSSQSSDKTLVFGQLSVEATFTGLPRELSGEHPWLSDFLARKTLNFSHTCFSGTAIAKLNDLTQGRLVSGAVTPQHGDPALGRVADNLAIRLLAVYHGQEDYSILVYPTNCDEWKSILPYTAPISPSEAALGYLIFVMPANCRLLLPPSNPLSQSQAESEALGARPGNQNRPSAREMLVKRLFKFDYNKLLPKVLLERPLGDHAFFLVIPGTKRDIEHALCHWLRACNPECRIFTSQQPGSWGIFRSVVESMPGVVIIHETLAWSLRRIPNLARYLVTRNDEYWCISEPIDCLPLYLPLSGPESPAPPGDMRLGRLFPYRTVIFLTPSFLVSEPQRSLEFFEWFTNQWIGKFHYRLVTAHNIHEYLSELAEERHRARQEMLKSSDGIESDIDANLSGLTRDDCSCRYAVASMAADLHLTRTLHAGPEAHQEDNSPLIYADPSIDPNDEQSLVNWFGWWATLRADQFRKFHVIGSSQTIRLHGCRRGERIVRVPKYSKVTLNDPDAVLEVLQERNDQVSAAEPSTHSHASSMSISPQGGNVVRFRETRWTFRSNLIRTEDSDCFADYLDTLTRLPGNRSLWGLYKFPVSWCDLDMATHFADFSSKYSRIHDWFKFSFPFGKSEDAKSRKGWDRYNTYVGFFYTIIDKEWDYPDVVPPQKPVNRHPWIAVYRPVNPHKPPYKRCEVIIWDPTARTRYPNGQAPAEKDLIFMQRQLIQHVRDHGDEKNHGTWLDQVWYGAKGWKRVTLGPPFDPSPEPAQQQTTSRSSPSGNLNNSSNTDSPGLFVEQHRDHAYDDDVSMALDDDSPSIGGGGGERKPEEEEDAEVDLAEYEDEQTRVIFHPPRGHSHNHLQNGFSRGGVLFRSKCINLLYEEARLATARGGGDEEGVKHMRYTFLPTMDWYREQKAEGRGFAHVNVDSWEGIFGLLKISHGAASKGKGAGGGGSASANEGKSGSEIRSSSRDGAVDSR
ncbi:hypothetical protein C7999DRAFT_10595 [Corynascus novoguineensis]|uniref:Chromo domain-containing protein n=1 Tax=Corynascus novoguineensis TaxID=1126955 RepID=A0AAN7HUK4_9PEZI|nr:hypothetical protein C7999DRAFT_10595 [Corynascus novoguineensis]